MDQLEQKQAVLHEEGSQVRAQMGWLMETIQVVARGQEIMAKSQEEMNQRTHDVTLIPTVIPTMENHVPPQGPTPFHILVGAPSCVPPPVLNPPVIEVNDH